jgi:hypothetical protein
MEWRDDYKAALLRADALSQRLREAEESQADQREELARLKEELESATKEIARLKGNQPAESNEKSFEQLAAEGRAKQEQDIKKKEPAQEAPGSDLYLGRRTAKGPLAFLFAYPWVLLFLIALSPGAFLMLRGPAFLFLSVGFVALLIGRRSYWSSLAKRELDWLKNLPFKVTGYQEVLRVPPASASLLLIQPCIMIDFQEEAPPKETLRDALSAVVKGCLTFAHEPNSEPGSESYILETLIPRKKNRWAITHIKHQVSYLTMAGYQEDWFPSGLFVKQFHAMVDGFLLPLSRSYPIKSIHVSFQLVLRGRPKDPNSQVKLSYNE